MVGINSAQAQEPGPTPSHGEIPASDLNTVEVVDITAPPTTADLEPEPATGRGAVPRSPSRPRLLAAGALLAALVGILAMTLAAGPLSRPSTHREAALRWVETGPTTSHVPVELPAVPLDGSGGGTGGPGTATVQVVVADWSPTEVRSVRTWTTRPSPVLAVGVAAAGGALLFAAGLVGLWMLRRRRV